MDLNKLRNFLTLQIFYAFQILLFVPSESASYFFFAFFLADLAIDNAIATACFLGFPCLISVLIFLLIDLAEYPFLSGIVISFLYIKTWCKGRHLHHTLSIYAKSLKLRIYLFFIMGSLFSQIRRNSLIINN